MTELQIKLWIAIDELQSEEEPESKRWLAFGKLGEVIEALVIAEYERN